MRAIIKYARDNSARYLSHLDMQRAFARAFRRSGLPVAFSEGCNPHIQMSFASPLSVGYATQGDYLEVKLVREIPPTEIFLQLSAVMPPDIRIVSAGKLADTAKKLMSLNASASYELVFDREIERETAWFMAAQSLVAVDAKKREVDVRAHVLDASAQGCVMTARIKNSSEQAMNPIVLARVFEGAALKKITRLECFAKTAEGEVPFSALYEH